MRKFGRRHRNIEAICTDNFSCRNGNPRMYFILASSYDSELERRLARLKNNLARRRVYVNFIVLDVEKACAEEYGFVIYQKSSG